MCQEWAFATALALAAGPSIQGRCQAGNHAPQARRRPGQLRTYLDSAAAARPGAPDPEHLSHCTPARRPNCRGKQPTTSSPADLMGFPRGYAPRFESCSRVLLTGERAYAAVLERGWLESERMSVDAVVRGMAAADPG